jgi:hypothetical protein
MNIRGGNMPSLIFNVKEVEETKTHTVNASGYLYVGRKYSGKEVVWIKLKERVAETV